MKLYDSLNYNEIILLLFFIVFIFTLISFINLFLKHENVCSPLQNNGTKYLPLPPLFKQVGLKQSPHLHNGEGHCYSHPIINT